MIKWGVIGLGNIAHRFVESLSYFEDAEFYAGASHNRQKRDAFLHEYSPKKVYENYDELLNDRNIDIVYIALPHKLHYDWALKAMKKEKAVLVEKPSVLSTKELEVLVAYSEKNHILFMEAMKTRFLPVTAKIHELIDSDKIGEITNINNVFMLNAGYIPESYLFDAQQGGALFDTGIYNIASTLDYIKEEITNIQADIKIRHNVDTYIKTTITFKNNKKAMMTNSMESENNRMMIIEGTKGQLTLNPFYRPEQIIMESNGEKTVIDFPLEYDDFYPEIRAAHQALTSKWIEHPLYDHAEMFKSIELMEKISNIKFKYHDSLI